MKYRTLGRTGLRVSEIGFGAWAIGGNSYGPTDDRISLKALEYAIDHGITFIDTADIYGEGHSEKLVGKATRGKRDRLVMATKVGWDFYHSPTEKRFDADHIRFAVGESLKRLETDYIDVYQLHNPSEEEIREGAFFPVLEELKKEGKIRYYGISIHNTAEGLAVLDGGKADAIQVIFNIMDQRPMPELLPRAEDKKIGIIAREPLNCGVLTGKYDLASRFPKGDHRRRWDGEKLSLDAKRLAEIKNVIKNTSAGLVQAALEFVLSEPAVSVVIPGAKTPEHVADHIRAVENPRLEPAHLEALRALGEHELFKSGFYHN